MFPDRLSIVTGTRSLPGAFSDLLAAAEPSDPLSVEIAAESVDKKTRAVEDIALTDIDGIGTIRKLLLKQQGIGSIELLAQKKPEDLVEILKISPHQAKDIIQQAAMKRIDNE